MERQDHELLAFNALGDSTRWAILELLSQGHRSVREVASRFAVSRPAISKHLRILREAGLVVEKQIGRERIQEISSQALEKARQRLATLGGDVGTPLASSAPVREPRVSEGWRCW